MREDREDVVGVWIVGSRGLRLRLRILVGRGLFRRLIVRLILRSCDAGRAHRERKRTQQSQAELGGEAEHRQAQKLCRGS
jgi:hypothetical protein